MKDILEIIWDSLKLVFISVIAGWYIAIVCAGVIFEIIKAFTTRRNDSEMIWMDRLTNWFNRVYEVVWG